ncbi:hypothetical protein CASFOL_027284 [Castilleja foliolosa]|uniref:polynucleotide adenylyltransferase n=1 Tax=Castilleja foliolosa TaxID=1961234 RepID=A0ABD3CEC8_9LAMI
MVANAEDYKEAARLRDSFRLFEEEEPVLRLQRLLKEAIAQERFEVVKDWVKELTRLRGYTDQMVEDANAVIFTFGSYRLGGSYSVHGPGADIDTLCIGPSYISREEDFFYVLHNMLTEMEDVSELQPVPDAHVPVMKFKFDGISIDLLYASISQLLVVPDIACAISNPKIGALPHRIKRIYQNSREPTPPPSSYHRYHISLTDFASDQAIASGRKPNSSAATEREAFNFYHCLQSLHRHCCKSCTKII